MLKKHKMLAEFVALEETEHGGIDISKSIKFMQDIGKLAKQHGFEAFAKGYPQKVLDYIPSQKTIIIKTVEDIAELTEDQFEMFIEDLRNWCHITRKLKQLSSLGITTKSDPGMTWIDSGEHKQNIEITAEIKITNKL